MHPQSRELLRRLGAGESIGALCREAGWSREEFDQWWRREAASRAPRCTGQVLAGVRQDVSIERDQFGIPHIFAESEADLWFGFGYAMAQDRLFQLDYLRRKGLGRLADVLGPEGLPLDIIARTVGLNRIARAEWPRLPAGTQQVLESFAAGINAWIETCGDGLPIELDAHRQPGDRERIPLVPHGPAAGDCDAGVGQTRARRRATLSRMPAGRRG